MKTPVLEYLPSQRGVTLIETMIVVVIIGVLAVMATPSFQEQMQQQRVEGAAESLVAALQNAKAEAVTANKNMAIVITSSGSVCTSSDCENQANAISTWCYGMTAAISTSPCNCSTGTDCATGSIVQNTDYTGVGITYNTSNSRSFESLRGSATTGTIRFFAGNNKSLGVTTSSIGRIRICKDGTSTLISYPDSGACP